MRFGGIIAQNTCISFLQFLPSALAALMHFFSVFTNLSTSPLALGQSGVTFRCLKHSKRANLANSSPLNGGPLSDLGGPNVANSWSSLGMTALADVDDTDSTNGNLESLGAKSGHPHAQSQRSLHQTGFQAV